MSHFGVLGLLFLSPSISAFLAEVNKVKLILKSPNGPCINEKDDNGRTALHIACEYDNVDCVKELIEAGALPNIRAKDGSTPLHVTMATTGHLLRRLATEV